MVIKRIAPNSCAKIIGTLYAILGIVVGAIFSLGSLAGAFASSEGAGIPAIIGVGAISVSGSEPEGSGLLATLIGAWLYNVLAGLVGGIEMDLQ